MKFTATEMLALRYTDKLEPGRCRWVLGNGLAYLVGPRGEKFPLRCGRAPVDKHHVCEAHATKEVRNGDSR